jgi:hypothetical protein
VPQSLEIPQKQLSGPLFCPLILRGEEKKKKKKESKGIAQRNVGHDHGFYIFKNILLLAH